MVLAFVLALMPSLVPRAATLSGVPGAVDLQRNGAQLTFDGQPYRYVGVNAYGILGCDNANTPYSAATLDAFFKSLPPHTLTRMWAFQGLPGSLDTAVQEAAANNQMLILSLANEYNNCTETAKDASWFQTGYQGAYLTYIKQVAAKYKDSPAIGMWELINEPRATGVDTATMAAFLETSAKAIKSVDPNHLVESGTLGEGEPGTTDYTAIHAGADIDVISLHEYDYENGGQIVSAHTANALAAGKALNKPVIIGETGVKASDSDCTSVGGTSSRQARADVFKQKFDGYLAAGIAGVNVWNWLPVQYNGCNYETIYPADPFMTMLRAYVIAGNPPPAPASTPSQSPIAPPTATPVPTNAPASATPASPTVCRSNTRLSS